jgi:glycosyltransferase involved in cell wall biosynthesis
VSEPTCTFHHPELLWVGAVLHLRGAHVVYDVHEDVPKQILSKPWIARWARPARLAGGHARRAGRRTAHRRHRGRDADRRPQVPPGKTGVVQNFPEASFAQADGAGAPPAERAEAFVYAGGLMEVQGAREMAQAFALLPPGMTGTIAGTFHPPALEREIAAMPGWRRVRYLGQVPRADVVQAMTRARAGIVLNHPTPNYVDAYPTKMFEYMARATGRVLGLPAVGRDRRRRRLRDRGRPTRPSSYRRRNPDVSEDPERARRLGRKGRRAIAERYNWETELRRLDMLYRRLA